MKTWQVQISTSVTTRPNCGEEILLILKYVVFFSVKNVLFKSFMKKCMSRYQHYPVVLFMMLYSIKL